MKCTGMNCPMQYPYDVSECPVVDSCRWRTLPITNAEKIRAMTDDELAEFISAGETDICKAATLKWLEQPAEVDE